MGTPPRDFKILMDSGSADFWVGAENCQTVQQQGAGGGGGGQGANARGLQRRRSGNGATQDGAAAQAAVGGAQDCGNHTFLGQQSSSSFVDTQKPFQVTYGSGAVAGTIVTDNINVAGLALDNHTFGTAQQETQQFTGVLFLVYDIKVLYLICCSQAGFDGLMGLAQSVCLFFLPISYTQMPTTLPSTL
jgi:hypothetical protein